MSVDISVVIPVYGCRNCLLELYTRLSATLEKITYAFEIILINDNSPDDAWETIQYLHNTDPRVKGINFSKNHGQHFAISAGIDYAEGNWVVVMDCDLQDQPEEIIKLYQKAIEGYDVVFGRRYERKDGFFKRLSSKMFFLVFDYFTESTSDNSIANFSIVSRKVILYFRQFRERNRSFPLFVRLIGFNSASININHSERFAGKSSYNFRKLINLAIDNIVAQSNKPLKLSIKIGFIISSFSFLYGIFLISRYFIQSIPVEGWTSVMVSIYFLAGLLLSNLGLLGLYIGKIFDETKNRPLYIVKDTIGFDAKENNNINMNGGDKVLIYK